MFVPPPPERDEKNERGDADGTDGVENEGIVGANERPAVEPPPNHVLGENRGVDGFDRGWNEGLNDGVNERGCVVGA